jgi:hypothetical protein
MGLLGLPKASDAEAEITTTALSDDELRVEFNGSLNMRDPSTMLKVFFDDLHHTMRFERRKSVRIDLRNLKYMNSVGFKYFVAWLTQHAETAPDKRYSICFMVTPKYHWQTVSMHALKAFSKHLITVEVDPAV